MIKRLNQLCLQDFGGYSAITKPEVLSVLRDELKKELIEVESELVDLDREYRLLVKGDETTRRMEVANRKLFLSRRSGEITYEVTEDEYLKIAAHRRYSKTKELQDSLAEQRQLREAIWGNK